MQMSRTYRKRPEDYIHAYGRFVHWDDEEGRDRLEKIREDSLKWSVGKYGSLFSPSWTWTTIIVKTRDNKPWDKPNKQFKQMNRQRERAKVKNAMRNGGEIPFFRKTDKWNWT